MGIDGIDQLKPSDNRSENIVRGVEILVHSNITGQTVTGCVLHIDRELKPGDIIHVQTELWREGEMVEGKERHVEVTDG